MPIEAKFCRSIASVILSVSEGSLFSQVIYCRGYSGEEPPLPIPNREVKLTIADGTAPPGGRVGSCGFLECQTSEDAWHSSFWAGPKTKKPKPSVTPSLSSLPSGEGWPFWCHFERSPEGEVEKSHVNLINYYYICMI